MTAAVTIAGLAPMIGGVITSTLMELLVYPAIFYLWRRRSLPSAPAIDAPSQTLPAISE